MKRTFLCVLVMLIGVSTVWADPDCVTSADFEPEFSISTIDLPGVVRTMASGVALELNPKSTVSDVSIRSIEATSDADLTVQVISEKRALDSYALTLTIRAGSDLTLEDLSDATFSLEALIDYSIEGAPGEDPQRKTVRLCLGDLDVDIRGIIEDVEDRVGEFFDSLEAIDSVFEVIDLVLTVARTGAEFMCDEREQQYVLLETIYDEHCSEWTSALNSIIIDGTDPDDACDGNSFCIANMTGGAGGSNCPGLYDRLLEAEANMSAVCSRIECAPVLTLEEHTESYRDPLGISRCEDTGLTDEACRIEFERVQGAFCPEANVTALEVANQERLSRGEDERLFSLPDACGEAREEILVLKDTSAGIVNSVQCMCLPAIQGYVGQIERMYEFGRDCFADDESSRACEESAYQFICELSIGAALRCNGLGLHEFSASTNIFTLPDGTELDFTDPDEAQRLIETSSIYVRSVDGDINVDTSRLAHTLCEAALGDEDIDFAALLDLDASVSTRQVGRLCTPGVELVDLEEPCICDLSASGSARLCGTDEMSSECVFDASTRESQCTAYTPDPTTEPVDRSAQHALTQLPPGVYGSVDGIYSCESVDVGARVIWMDEGFPRTTTLRSGPIGLHADQSDEGEYANRIYSCNGGSLKIEHKDPNPLRTLIDWLFGE